MGQESFKQFKKQMLNIMLFKFQINIVSIFPYDKNVKIYPTQCKTSVNKRNLAKNVKIKRNCI